NRPVLRGVQLVPRVRHECPDRVEGAASARSLPVLRRIIAYLTCAIILAWAGVIWDLHASEMRENPMPLHLVGETIDAKRAHQRAQAGELIQLVRGVYVDHDVDADATVLGHAVRIAHYLYPNAYLSSASAMLLAPTPDGRLFLSGRRNQRTRIRGLE